MGASRRRRLCKGDAMRCDRDAGVQRTSDVIGGAGLDVREKEGHVRSDGTGIGISVLSTKPRIPPQGVTAYSRGWRQQAAIA